jgi:K+-sensing histidine kinase KdpD
LTQIPKTFFTCCGIWRATMHGSRSQPATNLRTIGFLSYNRRNCAVMADKSSEVPTESWTVPWSDMVRFVRQLTHDLRNDLNALELQSAYIGELTQDQELTGEIKRLREVVSGLNSTLQLLSRAVGEVAPNVVTYPAGEFLADMRTQIERNFSKESQEITWDVQLQDGMLNVDPQLFQEVFVELFANAFQHDRGEGALVARARISDGRFLFSLHEPKAVFSSETQNWGREPLRKIRQRHYGLGLNRVRAIIEAHGGELQAQYDPKAATLVSTIALPMSGRQSENG